MRKEFVMRGKTASGLTEVLQFGKYKAGYAYRMTELLLWPTVDVGSKEAELIATITAAKTYEDPANPDFNNDGLIAVAYFNVSNDAAYPKNANQVINDTYLITQNLILAVLDAKTGSPTPVNWQCRFESVKMTGPEEAAINYKQFAISDE